MKKILFFLVCVSFVLPVFAQQNEVLAMRAVETATGNDVKTGTEAVSQTNAIKYILESYGNSKKLAVTFSEEHFLGEEISGKWNLFMQNYRRVYEQSVGFSNSSIEIVKPMIFNAVNKVNSYCKKMARNGNYSQNELTIMFGHVLDCANLLCYEEDTRNIEADIKAAKTPEQIVEVFKCIQINYH